MFICPTCNLPFESKKPKTYCSIKCYVGSPAGRAKILANMAAGREKGKGPERTGEETPCLNCGVLMYVKPFQFSGKRQKKYCSRLCYRRYMASRFDRHIGAVDSIPLLQNFDEFLSREVLVCLIPGCGWQGHGLSLHMNQAHGIKANQFKQQAGFNLTTGVISATMQRHLQGRGNSGTPSSLDQPKAVAVRLSNSTPYISRESCEHRSKAAILRTLNKNIKER